MVHLLERSSSDDIVVMDSDGEDRPEDLPTLLAHAKSKPGTILFGSRASRSEGLVFRMFYGIYKRMFRLLTGHPISFGNFCLVPGSVLEKLVHVPEIWNHFSAGIIKSRLVYSTVDTHRGHRISGESKMNFTALVVHGLSAVSVFIEKVAVRLISFSILRIIAVFAVRVLTDLGIPGWATDTVLGLTIVSLQGLLLSTVLTFIVLTHRSQKNFVPIFDCKQYVLSVRHVFGKG